MRALLALAAKNEGRFVTFDNPLRRHRADAVLGDAGVLGDQSKPFDSGLGNEEPVKRVPVMYRQHARLLRMVES